MKKENEIKLNRNKLLFSLISVAESEIHNAIKILDGEMEGDVRATLYEAMQITSRLMDRSGTLRLPK